MNTNLIPPNWDAWEADMCLIVSDAQYYFENYTNVVGEGCVKNTKGINDLDGRVTSLEQQIPVGPGGKGAYLNLGGTPDRYPLASEMVTPEDKETSFLVIARPDGIYFYNPETKQTIPPKQGGGTMAVHATFPQINTRRECIRHNTRHGMSGIYTAEVDKIGLDHIWKTHGFCNVLAVVTENGEEHQTAFHPDGIASRVFKPGIGTVPWKHIQGGTGGGGSVDLTDVENRLDALELEQLAQNSALFLNQNSITALQTVQADHAAILADHESRIEAVELGGGGGGNVDLTPVTDRLDILEAGHDDQETRIEALEAGGTGGGGSGTPVLSAEWVQLRSAMWPGYAPADGGLYSRTTYPKAWKAIQESKVPVCTDAEWEANPEKRGCFTHGDGSTTFRVPDYNGITVGSLGATFLRGDGLNSAGVDGEIQSDAIRNIEAGGFGGTPYRGIYFEDVTQLTGSFVKTQIPNGATVPSTSSGLHEVYSLGFDASQSVPVAADNHPTNVTGCWAVKMIETAGGTGGGSVDLDPINDRLDDLDNKHIAQGSEIKVVDTKLTEFMTNGLAPLTRRMGEAETEIIDSKDRIEVLENKPHPSFFQLTNTPTAGRPGELIGYNMGGDAITSYKRVIKMADLSDVPEIASGSATRLLTVKTDLSGYEFSDYPRLAPLQIAIEANKTRLDDQADEDIDHKARIVDLEGSRNLSGHLPKVFEAGNTVTANGRVDISGVYTVMPAVVGLSGMFPAATVCKMLVAVTKNGEELQTVFGEHAMASRVFPKGVNVAAWSTDVRGGPTYRGVWNPKTNAYPAHLDTDSRWDVVLDSGVTTLTYDGKTWKPGDRLLYTNATKVYSQQQATLGVSSVNGKTGAVVLTADDVGAMKHVTSAVVDCNDLKKAGSFGVAGGSANWCFGTSAGAIIVFFHNSTYMTQLACHAGNNQMRMRTCNANNWSSWIKIYSEYEKPTAADVQAVNLNYGVGAAGKDIADMALPEIKGGNFCAGGSTTGAYVKYMPFMQAVRAGGSDGTGQIFQIQANHATKKLAYRSRDKGLWNDWIEVYSNVNKPNASDIGAFVQVEYDADFNDIKESGAYRFSGSYTNGPEDVGGGNKPTYSQLLHVKGGGDTQWQMIGDFRGKELWWRGYNDSFVNGGDWHRVYHSGRPPTPDELSLPYAARNRYDVRDFGVVGDGVTDDTDAFVRACNTVYGYNGTLTAPGHLHIKLNGVKRTVTVRCNMDLNNAIVDLSDFEGMVMFSRKVIDPVTCWGAGKDPANPAAGDHPLITALQVENKLQDGALKGWENIPEVEDSYFMINTEEPLFSYRGGIKNRCEYNKIGRWGLLESFIRYPMDPKKISRIMYWPMEKQMTVAQNIVWKLGSNDLQSPNVRIRTSNFTAKNWKFLQDNFVNTNMNPTVLAVERSANIVMEDISFQWATHSTATTGFTYNIALNDNYNVSLKRVTGTGDGWGATGSNNSRKVYFEQCNLSRIDFHEPMHEYLSLKDCHVGSWGVLATAMGDINIEGGTLFRKKNPRTVDRNGFIRSRTDSGFCDGNISIRNVTIETDQPGVSNLLIHQNDAPDQDFIVPGSPVDFCFWKNITIDNVKFSGPAGSTLNLYPTTNCRNMAESGMRWPYTVNITNCTGGNLVVDAKIDAKLLPYKNVYRPENGFKEAIPNHVLNITESSVGLVDIQDTSADRRFVMQVNMDNINPTAKHDRAPDFITRFGGKFSLRNSTLNSVDFMAPLSPLMATFSGCSFVHDRLVKDDIVQGFNDKVYPAIIDSVLSTTNRPSIDTVLDCKVRGNTYFVDGVEVVVPGADLNDLMDAITRIDAEQTVQDVTLADHLARIRDLELNGGGTGGGGGTVDLTPILDRLDTLETAPKPDFFDLTNTPSAGSPGKLVGYNMAGDSIVSYDRVSSMTDLSDTPAGLTGSATKVLTVKVDESGFEFTDFPRLGPIEARLDALSDGHDDQETRIEILEMGGGGGSVDLTPVMNRLTDLESGHGDQEVRIETLENAPSVDLTPLEDEINILKDGHDDLEVRIDTLENKPDVDLTPIEDRLDDHGVRIDVLEAKPDVDLTPLEGQVSDLKDSHDDQETRIEALENAPAPVGEFINLSDVEIDLATDTQSLVFVDEFGKVRANPVNPMLLHGAVPISIKSIGAKLNYVVNASASGSLFAATPYIVLDSTTTRTHTLCRFVAYDDANSTVTQGREGRTTYIFNYGNVAQNLRLGTTQRFFSTTGFESTARVIPAKTSHAYCPVILDNGGVMTECWAFMGAAPLEGIDLSGIEGAILNLQTSVADHQTRIEILEMGGGGGSVDLTPVLDRLKSVEEINTDQQLQIDTMGTMVGDMFTDHEDRIVVLENKPDVDLTPLELRLDDLDTTVAGHDIRIDDLENAPAVDLTPITGRLDVLETGHTSQQVILDNHETRLDAVDVTVASHDGRIDALENAPAVDLTPLTGRLDTLETGHTSQQVILDDHGTRVGALENAPGVDLTPVLTRLTDVESVNTAQQGEIGAVDVRVTTLENKPDVDLAPLTDRVTVAEGEIIDNKGRLNVLENAPHPSFFDLTNTPSAGNPGKLVGYNMAGDSIVSYDRISNMTDLSDVPSSLVGNATKVLTVKSDQTGFEFTDYPRLAPLETRLTTLEDGHDDQEIRIEALENAPPPTGVSEFIGLSDTPDSFVGNAGKSMIVKGDESGIEFIDSPEHGILAALEAGNLPIKWNNLKQKIAASSGNITTTNIAENAFVLGLGGNSPRYYYLPDIVDADTSPLPANSVREGRLTIISQQGTSVRTVSLTAGCKFAINSVMSTTDQSIPPGQSWILLPAIYGNGDRVWSMIGSFSSNNGYSDLYNGYTKIGSNSISSDTLFATASVTAANVVHKSFVTIAAGSARTIYLPPFVAFNSTTLLVSGQCRQGKVLTVGGTGGGDIHLALSAGQKFIVNGIETDTTRIMPSGILETYVATVAGGVQKWVLINRCKGDGSPVEMDGVNATIAALEARIAALEAHHP